MLNQETKAILVEGRSIINYVTQWGKCANARREDGKDVSPTSAKACRWCAFGVLNKARYDGGYSVKALNLARRELANAMRSDIAQSYSLSFGDLMAAITSFNDWERTTHTDVIEAFNEAIENCE